MDSRKPAPISLTDLSLRAFMKAPPDKQTDIPVSGSPGLQVRISPKGRITWSLRLRVVGEGGQSQRGRRAKGNQYRLTLGTYPAVTIKSARAKAAEYGRQAEAGEHPVRALRLQAIARDDTVERLVEKFLTDYAEPNLRSWRNARSTLRLHVVPAWGSLPVNSIDEREVARFLMEVAKGKVDPSTGVRVSRPGAAGEVRKWGALTYSWGKRSGLVDRNPFLGARNPIKLQPRQRFLDMTEARAVWNSAAQLLYPWREIFQLLLLTGCRMSEIAHAEWSWLDEGEARLIVPVKVHKSKRTILVALSTQAMMVLKTVPRWSEGDFIFSTRGGAIPVSSVPRENVDKLHLKAETIAGRNIEHFVVHDFRRTVRTHLSRLGVPEVVAELVAGHALRGLAATYNIYDFEKEKRAALELWSAELTSAG